MYMCNVVQGLCVFIVVRVVRVSLSSVRVDCDGIVCLCQCLICFLFRYLVRLIVGSFYIGCCV